WSNSPLLLGLTQVVGHANIDAACRPVFRNLRDILWRNRGASAAEHSWPAAAGPDRSTWRSCSARRSCSAWSAVRRPGRTRRPRSSGLSATDRNSLDREFKRRIGAHGMELIGAFFGVLTGHWPSVFPKQRPNIKDTCTPS